MSEMSTVTPGATATEQAHLKEIVRYNGAILNWTTALRTQSQVAPFPVSATRKRVSHKGMG
jgi:hypothetical protein